MNWMKYRLLFLVVSGTVICAGIFSLVKWGLNIGVDFRGGSIIEYKFTQDVSEGAISDEIKKTGITLNSIQKASDKTYLLRLPPISEGDRKKVSTAVGGIAGKVDELRFENVGPTVGPELVKKTIVALTISAGFILLWVTYQFKSIKFGTSAVLAMFHDSLVVVGLYSLLGHFFGAEVDFLFVTAVLTILSFSVHDTIVVYDRIREIKKKTGGETRDLANEALTETMVRSFNNSMTIVFMLVALILLGGVTIKWFAVTLLIGTISGTYSSPFVAVPILVTWEEIQEKIKNRK